MAAQQRKEKLNPIVVGALMTLHEIAWLSLALAGLCALAIAIDELRHPQPMAIMNLVWPISALYFSVFGLWAYFSFGRAKTGNDMHSAEPARSGEEHQAPVTPTLAQIAIGTSHCGAGCTIADVGTEFAIAALGIVWFGSILWTDYLLDFIVAWALGILFQYLAIKPMRQDLSAGAAIWAAIKADTLSILAFQVGMYVWMALVHYKLFASAHLTPFDPRYWLMMQVAMIFGFATSFPMNRVLIRRGLKEAM